MRNARDIYWHVGAFLVSRGRQGDISQVRNHALSVLVKAFFIPLMFCFFVNDWEAFSKQPFVWNGDIKYLFSYGYRYLYFIDIAYTVIGYVFTTRLLNSQIRWPEDKAGGWFFCLLCYVPFWQLIGRDFLDYHDHGFRWVEFFADSPTMLAIWSGVIFLLSLIYVISSAHFGLRFSNLTYRGLVSHGMFRVTKHPAYVSKNLSWWMISVPCFASDISLALKNSLTLLMVNYVYYQRAKYEEKCCGKDPAYQKYSEHMEVKSIFTPVGRFLRKLKKL